MNKSER